MINCLLHFYIYILYKIYGALLSLNYHYTNKFMLHQVSFTCQEEKSDILINYWIINNKHDKTSIFNYLKINYLFKLYIVHF